MVCLNHRVLEEKTHSPPAKRMILQQDCSAATTAFKLSYLCAVSKHPWTGTSFYSHAGSLLLDRELRLLLHLSIFPD